MRTRQSTLPTGNKGEDEVARIYQDKGYKILFRNYSVFGKKKMGELDMICRRERLLVFVEVKTRSSESFMRVEQAVDHKKKYYLRRMVYLFLSRHPEYEDYFLRVDVAAVLLNPLDKSITSVRITENVIEDE